MANQQLSTPIDAAFELACPPPKRPADGGSGDGGRSTDGGRGDAGAPVEVAGPRTVDAELPKRDAMAEAQLAVERSFPPEPDAAAMNPAPVEKPASAETSGGCSVGGPEAAGGALAWVAMALVTLRRRRSRR